MGRFHRHDDGTEHNHDHTGAHHHEHTPEHEHADDHRHGHTHEHGSASEEHGDHSGYKTGSERVLVLERIFDENDVAAAHNRKALDEAGILCLNLMSSPGAGKTTLLQRTLTTLRDLNIRAGVIEGDIETSIDADRLAGLGAQISLLNTANGFGGECHLDAPMVARALTGLDLTTLDVVLVENVGNLVCPAEFDVGAHRSVMVYSITEGEEKPLKYPVMFRTADVVIVNKVDLLPHLDFDIDLFEANVRQVNPDATIIRLSARTGEGLVTWEEWLVGDGPAAH